MIAKINLFVLIYFSCFKNSLAIVCDYGYIPTETSCEECGVTESQPNIRIVGGIEAQPNSWPSHVYIQQTIKGDYKFPDNYSVVITSEFECGGTLISQNAILTTVNCIKTQFIYNYNGVQYILNYYQNKFYPSLESTFTIYLGMHNRSDLNSVKRKVKTIIVHPNYNSINNSDSIALLILSENVEFSKTIKPACLPKYISFYYPKPGQDCFAIGWGTTSESSVESSMTLQNVKLKIYNESFCKNIDMLNSYSQICAGNYEGGQDTCAGDGGGGLYVIDNSTGKSRYVVSGLTFFGIGCGRPKYPGTSYYLKWINENVFGYGALQETTASTILSNSTFTETNILAISLGAGISLLVLSSIGITVVACCCLKRNKPKQEIGKNLKSGVKTTKERASNPYYNKPKTVTNHNYLEPRTFHNSNENRISQNISQPKIPNNKRPDKKYADIEEDHYYIKPTKQATHEEYAYIDLNNLNLKNI